MMIWTSRPNGGHVTRCEAVWAKREEDGPPAPLAPAGAAPPGWKVVGGAAPHATTSAPTPASKNPRDPRHIRRPPRRRLPWTAGTLPTLASRFTAPGGLTGPAGEPGRPAGQPATPAGDFWPARGWNIWPASGRTCPARRSRAAARG